MAENKSILDNLIKEEIQVLVERYPFLKPYNVQTGKLPEDYDYTYIFELEIPVGWERMFLQMCEDIRQPLIDSGFLNKFRLGQVKEKFGEMRVCCYEAPDKVCDIIEKYEQMSYYICSQCGKPSKYLTNGWIIPLCKKCYEGSKSLGHGTEIIFQDYYVIISFVEKNKKITIKKSFKNEWDKYIESLA